ncbi:MAG: hypothetical protein AAF217_07315 [Pseudomonadota bacterium]
MRFRTGVIIASVFGVLSSTAASANPLSGNDIRDTISGKKVYLATKWGIEFPLIYSTNGRVTGDGSATGLGKYMTPRETGNWWIAGNRMCQKFPTWYDGRTFCFKLEKKNTEQLIWRRDDGTSGTARVS